MKLVRKGYLLCDSNHVTLRKRQSCGGSKIIGVCQGAQGGRAQVEHGGCSGSKVLRVTRNG